MSDSASDDRSEYDPAFLGEADLDEGDLAIELLESVSDAVLAIDAESRIVYATPRSNEYSDIRPTNWSDDRNSPLFRSDSALPTRPGFSRTSTPARNISTGTASNSRRFIRRATRSPR